ncbi:MAG: hypothetical protein INF44_02545 [Thalassospira sp.]|jgi:hypothetical protein|nr:hypothetical protein [Thalassospira sp.]
MDNLTLADNIDMTMQTIETETSYLQSLVTREPLDENAYRDLKASIEKSQATLGAMLIEARRRVKEQNDAAAYYATAAITESMGEVA